MGILFTHLKNRTSMKYKREYKQIAKRMAEAAELEQAWGDVEKVYGKKATKQLKELTPADPLLLHDLMVVSHLNDGKTKKEVTELLVTYTDKDWAYDMENFAHTIKKAKKLYKEKHGR